ncbi:translation initiation factor IF-2-like [Lutra lutra]|uniref:translation initiation factor IF-2-like n=1 Tax=Lutra lutra TaxID=9657 RepID=UPI001FD56C5E|nr:translation initiation factor IF-2-like [Lutra lutra]XP_047555346.1 translation initiation factor IF-2-like [Lutra lutra]XP_047555435.1 translation initiation factor IF-2-like [Lutra lutra]
MGAARCGPTPSSQSPEAQQPARSPAPAPARSAPPPPRAWRPGRGARASGHTMTAPHSSTGCRATWGQPSGPGWRNAERGSGARRGLLPGWKALQLVAAGTQLRSGRNRPGLSGAASATRTAERRRGASFLPDLVPLRAGPQSLSQSPPMQNSETVILKDRRSVA